ncbi:ISL3 family transposase [Secundilactobacillus folii]|uniref:ISL3 family transposase n=1 Tax=Secundilactobacillus folii TaxID=2678357 RepID=A0A7X2XXB4_9LACO|nr:ISL3 family transposase [Secundilactobacillus folii]MTV82648.1 ISL3 family transposase [Secundilactobacillus folii]
MSLTSKSIRLALEIKDPNIIFTEDAEIELIHGTQALVYHGRLDVQADRCPQCGFADEIVHFGTNQVCIVAPSFSYRPTYLKLICPRFRCKRCATVFQGRTDYVRSYCVISEPVRQMILYEVPTNQTLTAIGRRYHVSDKTVQRIIDEETRQHNFYQTTWLPEHLAFDEFKATDKMSFIWADSDRREIGAILPSRTSYQITTYFERFPLKVRQQVKTVSLDLNAGYIKLIPRLFPNAKVVVDRFHIVQMVSTALNMVRVQVMKTIPKRSKDYRFMKREWKVFLKRFNELDAVRPTYHVSVGYYDTAVNLISKCLDLDPRFRGTYETYQAILTAVRERDVSTLQATLNAYHPQGNRMDQAIKSLKKYQSQVLNALRMEYSNGFLEGINSQIKKIKNTAYGYKNWLNFINRIFLERVWFKQVKKTTVN